MRLGGLEYAFLALALSACASPDVPLSGFDTITIEVPPQRASQLGSSAPVSVPQPARKPAQVAVAEAPSRARPQAKVPRQAQQPPPDAPPAQTLKAKATTTLTPEAVALRSEPEAAPAPQSSTTPEPTGPQVAQDPQGRTTITPHMPNLRQLANCKDAIEAICRELANCAWIDAYALEPGANADGHCESR